MHQKHPPAKVAVSRPGVAPSAAYAPREATPAAINATITAARKIRVRDIIRPPVRPPRSFQARELALDRIRELEILFRDDAALVMRRDRERDAPIVHRDVIGMMIYLFGDFRDAIDEADRVHKFLEGVLLRDRFASALPPGQRLQLLGDLFGAEFRHDLILLRSRNVTWVIRLSMPVVLHPEYISVDISFSERIDHGKQNCRRRSAQANRQDRRGAHL